jgi:hypothetical protein
LEEAISVLVNKTTKTSLKDLKLAGLSLLCAKFLPPPDTRLSVKEMVDRLMAWVCSSNYNLTGDSLLPPQRLETRNSSPKATDMDVGDLDYAIDVLKSQTSSTSLSELGQATLSALCAKVLQPDSVSQKAYETASVDIMVHQLMAWVSDNIVGFGVSHPL